MLVLLSKRPGYASDTLKTENAHLEHSFAWRLRRQRSSLRAVLRLLMPLRQVLRALTCLRPTLQLPPHSSADSQPGPAEAGSPGTAPASAGIDPAGGAEALAPRLPADRPSQEPAPGGPGDEGEVIELLSDDDEAGAPEVLDLTQSPPGSPRAPDSPHGPGAPPRSASPLPASLATITGVAGAAGGPPARPRDGSWPRRDASPGALGKRTLPASLAQHGAPAAQAAKRAAREGGAGPPGGAHGAPAAPALRWDTPRTDVQRSALASALDAAMQRKRAERSAGGGAAGNPEAPAHPGPGAGAGAAHPVRPALPWLRPGFDAEADRTRWGGAPAVDPHSYGSAFGGPVQSPYERIVRAAGSAAGAAAQHLYTAATGERRMPASLQAAGRVLLNGFAGGASSSGGGGAGRPLAHPTHSEADAQVGSAAVLGGLHEFAAGDKCSPVRFRGRKRQLALFSCRRRCARRWRAWRCAARASASRRAGR